MWNVGYIQLPDDVEPGSLVTFNFKLSQMKKGWQYFQCGMMKDDGTLFGIPSKCGSYCFKEIVILGFKNSVSPASLYESFTEVLV
ncbi:MAG: hypothetical protein IPH77_17445 [Ignavibacteria bacterium]|nr:hypothetical protein [Ignavibacteria bacterium]